MSASKMAPSNLLEHFKSLKRTGNYRRKIKKRSNEIMNLVQNTCQVQQQSVLILKSRVPNKESNSFVAESSSETYYSLHVDEEIEDTSSNKWLIESDNEDEETSLANVIEVEDNFRTQLTEWALTNQPTQQQLRELLKVCNNTLPFQLPQDPRTILSTPRILTGLVRFEDGSHYWHHGLIHPLKLSLNNVKSMPDTLSLNVNVDGLTIYESSREEFWPILCNIHELKFIEPIVIGIYCGIGM